MEIIEGEEEGVWTRVTKKTAGHGNTTHTSKINLLDGSNHLGGDNPIDWLVSENKGGRKKQTGQREAVEKRKSRKKQSKDHGQSDV